MDSNNHFLDDCLRQVLFHLPLAERLRLEGVCRRWNRLMPYTDISRFHLNQLYWPQRHISRLEYDKNGLTYSQQVMSPKWLSIYLQTVFCRLGRHLTELCLSPRGVDFCALLTFDLLDFVVTSCPSLRQLDISRSLIEDNALCALSNTRLEYLNMSACEFLDKQQRKAVTSYDPFKKWLTEYVSNNSCLSRLNLANLPFTPVLSSSSLKMVHLMALKNLTSDSLQTLCESCPSIESLGLSGCSGIDRFDAILLLTKLRSLWVNSTRFSTTDLNGVCTHLCGVEKLRLDDCPAISSFDALKGLSRLTMLWVGNAPTFTDVHLGKVAKHGHLENVVVSQTKVTNQGIKYLAIHCRNLRQLSAIETRIDDEAAMTLLERCPRLEMLNLQSTPVSNAMLPAVANAFALGALFLQSCRRIDDDGFEMLLDIYHRRTQCQRRQTRGKPHLVIMTGDWKGNIISQSIVERLSSCGIQLIVQKPILALTAL